ncbi:MAG: YdcH family protein [Sphingomonadaceae bacterium]
MSDKFVAYLRKEHQRLEDQLAAALKDPFPDQLLIARLKKLKLAIKDQIAWNDRPMRADRAA